MPGATFYVGLITWPDEDQGSSPDDRHTLYLGASAEGASTEDVRLLLARHILSCASDRGLWDAWFCREADSWDLDRAGDLDELLRVLEDDHANFTPTLAVWEASADTFAEYLPY
jgi:hypothetical protein